MCWVNEDLMKVNKLLFLNDASFVGELMHVVDVGGKVDNGEVENGFIQVKMYLQSGIQQNSSELSSKAPPLLTTSSYQR